MRPVSKNSCAPRRISRSVRGVRNDRPRPSRKMASSKLVLPDAFGPLIRLQRGANSSSMCSRQRKSRTSKRISCTRGTGRAFHVERCSDWALSRGPAEAHALGLYEVGECSSLPRGWRGCRTRPCPTGAVRRCGGLDHVPRETNPVPTFHVERMTSRASSASRRSAMSHPARTESGSCCCRRSGRPGRRRRPPLRAHRGGS